MKIVEALKFGIKKLSQKKIATARLDCEIILSEILKKDKSFLYTHPEKKITAGQAVFFEKQISKRAEGFPTAYLVKNKEFYGLNFIVSEKTLVPRPETEILVDETFNFIVNLSVYKKINFYDIGTGSGCIILSLADKFKKNNQKLSNFKFISLDICPQALKIAKINADKLKLKNNIKFIESDLLSSIKKFKANEIHLFLANLPYLTKDQIANSPTIKKEPKLALDGGVNGLKFYKKLIKQFKSLSQDNLEFWAIFEIDPNQAKILKKIIKSEFPNFNIALIKDYSKKIRFLEFSNCH